MAPRIRGGMVTFAVWAAWAAPLAPQDCPPLREPDRVRLAAAFEIAEQWGDSLWPGWTATPFATLLVLGEHEYLLRHPRPSDDFTALGVDSVLGTTVRCRARRYAHDLLATFPAVGGIPTVVIGAPEATHTSSTSWVLTLLHEYFHAHQYSRPGYYDGVNALGLSGGDETGMWMLNYPFPYDLARVVDAYGAASRALAAALRGEEGSVGAWRETRERLDAALAEPDRGYLHFSGVAEGIARYTEYRIGRLAAAGYEPSEAIRALPDYLPFAAAADSIYARILAQLEEPDRLEPGWRERYFVRRFTLDDS